MSEPEIIPPRPLRVLDELPVAEWTQYEAFLHLLDTFQRNVRMFPDIMERYVTATGLTDDKNEQVAIMQAALRETIHRRFPQPGTITQGAA